MIINLHLLSWCPSVYSRLHCIASSFEMKSMKLLRDSDLHVNVPAIPGINVRASAFGDCVYSAFCLGWKSIRMQSFIKTPASSSHCVMPTFIKLRARKCECQGQISEREHTCQVISITEWQLSSPSELHPQKGTRQGIPNLFLGVILSRTTL